MPVPGNDAAGGELDLHDGRALVGVAPEDGECDAIGCTMRGRVFLGRGFADDGGVWRLLYGRGQKGEKKCGEKNRFHVWLRLVSEYVSWFEGRVSMEIA
jgi:hypothetical protein